MSQIADPRPQMFLQEKPWGSFEQFCLNEATTVKILAVTPGSRLSLQTHASRAEFWRVLDGPVEVTLGGSTCTAPTGESFWIPIGTPHRLGNAGDRDARVLEIAFGEFDEEDIHRLEDDYSRGGSADAHVDGGPHSS